MSSPPCSSPRCSAPPQSRRPGDEGVASWSSPRRRAAPPPPPGTGPSCRAAAGPGPRRACRRTPAPAAGACGPGPVTGPRRRGAAQGTLPRDRGHAHLAVAGLVAGAGSGGGSGQNKGSSMCLQAAPARTRERTPPPIHGGKLRVRRLLPHLHEHDDGRPDLRRAIGALPLLHRRIVAGSDLHSPAHGLRPRQGTKHRGERKQRTVNAKVCTNV